MYYLTKKMEIAACHRLELNYESKCSNIHGHNWHVCVYCRSEVLNENGMVCDFKEIKDKIHGYLDHGVLNDLLPFNPTAENIAKWITDEIPTCYKAEVQESDGNTAIYEVSETKAEKANLSLALEWLQAKGYLTNQSSKTIEELISDFFASK